jgi:hypothetical protein
VSIGNPNHIDAQWQSYREILPAEAEHAQILETKRAFFAGVLSMWNAVMGPLLDEGEEPTPADMQRLAEIQEELDAFGRSGGLI